MVHLLPIQDGQVAPCQEQHVGTYWETQASNGKPQVTATKNCPSSASLVSVRLDLPANKKPLSSKSMSFGDAAHHAIYWFASVYFTDSGRAIVCPGRNTTLQCGSGQVIMINRGFYGRKNVHYCRSMHSLLTTPPRLYCSWVDVREWLTGKTNISALFRCLTFMIIAVQML